MTAFSVLHPPTLFWIVLIYCIFALLGRFLIKNNFVLGAVLAYLITSGASATAYTLCHIFGLGPFEFWLAFLGIGIFTFWAARQSIPEHLFLFAIENDVRGYIYLAICVFLVLGFTYLSTISVTEASAATQFFQAWNPIIASHIRETGEFGFSGDANLKMGMLLSSDYYAANTRGLIVAAALLGIADMQSLFYLYNALSILATVLVFTLLLQTLLVRKSYFPAILFLFLLAYFALTETNTRIFLVSNLSDEVLYLSAASVVFALFFNLDSQAWVARLKAAVFLSIFMAIGRNYGLAWFGALALVYILVFLRSSKPHSLFDAVNKTFNFIKKDWALWAVAVLITGKEILQIILFGTQFPRIAISTKIEYNWPQLEAAILNGLNILYTGNGYMFTLHSIYIPILALSAGLLWYNRSGRGVIRGLFLPLIILAFPILLEVLLQFRKSLNFNKLYVPVIFFSIWYTPWCIRYMIDNMPKLSSAKLRISVFSFSILLIAIVFWVESSPRHRKTSLKDAFAFNAKMITDRLNGFVRYERQEKALVDQLRATMKPKRFQHLVAQPAMYFHYEPGLGYRYYLGGNIGNDFDFFSPSTLKLIEKAKTGRDFFCKLGMPNLLVYLINDRVPYFAYHKNYHPVWMTKNFDQTVVDAGYKQAADAGGLRLYIHDEAASSCN